MSITVTITEDTPAEILATIGGLAAAFRNSAIDTGTAAGVRGADKAAEPKAAKAPAKAKDPEPEAPAETEIDFERDVASRIQKLTAAKGRGVTLEVLGEFGVERASHLDAARLPELIAAIDKELAR